VISVSDRQQDSISHGERYARSDLTGNWYRVTAWEELGDGKIVAHEKEEVEESEVPPIWREGIAEVHGEVGR